MNEPNLARFLEVYSEELAKAVKAYPDEYPWHKDTPVVVVSEKMAHAIRKGTFNKDGRAFKGTCKRLGLAHTYKAINGFIR
jgi:hypothetical protein